jgi:hypothetical protein
LLQQARSLSQIKTAKLCFMKRGCANENNHRQTLSVNLEKVESKTPGEFSQRNVCVPMYKTPWMELDLTSTTMGTILVEVVLSDTCCILAVISFISRWRLWRQLLTSWTPLGITFLGQQYGTKFCYQTYSVKHNTKLKYSKKVTFESLTNLCYITIFSKQWTSHPTSSS